MIMMLIMTIKIIKKLINYMIINELIFLIILNKGYDNLNLF